MHKMDSLMKETLRVNNILTSTYFGHGLKGDQLC